MKRLLGVTAVGEAATGLALLVCPALLVNLLFGAQTAGAGIVMSRVAAIALLALGLACWPGRQPSRTALCAMATYSLLVGLYFAYLGLRGEYAGPLLWPAALVHLILTALLAKGWLNEDRQPAADNQASAPEK
jgi:hypothetical protein